MPDQEDAAPGEAPATDSSVTPPADQPPTDDAPPAPQSAERRSPGQWAAILFPASERGRLHADAWKHGAAEGLHGWMTHEHHAGAPIELTREDYESALRAAETLVTVTDEATKATTQTYVPHPAALSPHHQRRN